MTLQWTLIADSSCQIGDPRASLITLGFQLRYLRVFPSDRIIQTVDRVAHALSGSSHVLHVLSFKSKDISRVQIGR